MDFVNVNDATVDSMMSRHRHAMVYASSFVQGKKKNPLLVAFHTTLDATILKKAIEGVHILLILSVSVGSFYIGYMGVKYHEIMFPPPPAPPIQEVIPTSIFEQVDQLAFEGEIIGIPLGELENYTIETEASTDQYSLIPGNIDMIYPVPIPEKPEIKLQVPTEIPTYDFTPQPPPPPIEIPVLPPPPPPVYQVNVYGLSKAQIRTASDVAVGLGMVPKAVLSKQTSFQVWSVFAPNRSGNVVIKGVNVSKLKDFDTRDNALIYANALDLNTTYVRKEDITTASYNLYYCCGEIDLVNKLVTQAGISRYTLKEIEPIETFDDELDR